MCSEDTRLHQEDIVAEELRELFFVTANENKVREAQDILDPLGFRVRALTLRIEELQTLDADRLVKSKALEAFDRVGRPLFVEHTGLSIPYLNDFPGGLTQVFWDRLQADKFCQLFGATSDPSVDATTRIVYVDGAQTHLFVGRCRGTIPPEPRGDRTFQWDCVFQPEGYDETYAEMGELKNSISMRRHALDAFAAFLGE